MCSCILSFFHEGSHGFSHFRWIINNSNSVSLEASNLRFSVTFTTRNDGTSVSHSSSWRGGLPSNKTNNWKVSWIVGRKPFSSLLFSLTTNFSNENDTFSLWIRNETFKDINEIGSVEWISTDSDNCRLSEILSRCLINSFISQSSRS